MTELEGLGLDNISLSPLLFCIFRCSSTISRLANSGMMWFNTEPSGGFWLARLWEAIRACKQTYGNESIKVSCPIYFKFP